MEQPATLRYALLFPDALQPVHLSKEIGQIPSHLHRDHGWRCEIWATFPADGLPDIPVVGIGRGMAAVWHAAARASRVDLLQVMHLSPLSLAATAAVKAVHPQCLTWAKLDYDSRSMDRLTQRLGHRAWRAAYRMALSHVDVLSAETEEMTRRVAEVVEALRPARAPRVVCLPNGGMPPSRPAPPVRSGSALFVGRIGSRPKATEILLAAFAVIAATLPEATLEMAGPLEPGWDVVIQRWRESVAAEVSVRLQLLGEVRDRNALARLYAGADLFVLPSRWESSGIAMIEAACQGCWLLVSDVGAARDLLRVTGFGVAVPPGDARALERAWRNALHMRRTAEERAKAAAAAFAAFSWEGAAERIVVLHAQLRARDADPGPNPCFPRSATATPAAGSADPPNRGELQCGASSEV